MQSSHRTIVLGKETDKSQTVTGFLNNLGISPPLLRATMIGLLHHSEIPRTSINPENRFVFPLCTWAPPTHNSKPCYLCICLNTLKSVLFKMPISVDVLRIFIALKNVCFLSPTDLNKGCVWQNLWTLPLETVSAHPWEMLFGIRLDYKWMLLLENNCICCG